MISKLNLINYDMINQISIEQARADKKVLVLEL